MVAMAVAMVACVSAEMPPPPRRSARSATSAGESVAIAGEADTFEHALLEGALQLVAGAPSVLLVVAEELPPPAYAQWIADVPFSYAVALRLGKTDTSTETPAGGDWQLRLGRGHGDAPCAWPHALDFLRALLARETAFQHTWKARRWNWQRTR